ncbi:MAG: hypothetical protein U1C66_00110, partial [Patescibacteria group bacterium]|nr:hypothetical protein [Patescibacteria group bacterium]
GNSNGAYHWARTANPFTLQLGDNVSSTWDSYLNTASTDWTQSSVLDTSVVAGKAGSRCNAQTGRVEVCAKKYGKNGWLGIAQIWISGNHITKGLVKMNDTYFLTSAYNKASWRAMVMCQEIGHTFGLGHQDEGFYNPNLGSCMDYTNDPARNDGLGNNLKPNAHDYDVLEQIYAHLDTTTTVVQSSTSSRARGTALGLGGSLPFGLSVPEIQPITLDLGDDPKNWGVEISRSVNGHASVFAKKVDGEQVLTHVFWAEPQEGEHDH